MYIIKDIKIQVDKNIIDIAINTSDLNIIKIILECNNNNTNTIDENTIQKIIQLSFDKGNIDMLKFICENFKIIPNQKTILKYIDGIPIIKFLIDNKLILVPNTTPNTTTNTTTNINRKPWFMC